MPALREGAKKAAPKSPEMAQGASNVPKASHSELVKAQNSTLSGKAKEELGAAIRKSNEQLGVMKKQADESLAKETVERTKKTKPIDNAIGPHTTWKSDPQTQKLTRHETWKPNPQNPAGYDSVQSTDIVGKPHFNKQTEKPIPTPHTQGKNIPGGVRPAKQGEVPKQ